MKRNMASLLVTCICVAALLAVGCSNKEALKKDEAVVPVAAKSAVTDKSDGKGQAKGKSSQDEIVKAVAQAFQVSCKCN